MVLRNLWTRIAILLASSSLHQNLFASEADIKIPELNAITFTVGGSPISGMLLLYIGLLVCVLGIAFGLIQYVQTKALDVHSSMAAVSNTIWETCKTYLWQQGKFLGVLWFLIAAAIAYYFYFLQHTSVGNV